MPKLLRMHNLEDSAFQLPADPAPEQARMASFVCRKDVARPAPGDEDPEDSGGEEEDEEEETMDSDTAKRWLALGTRCFQTPSALRPPPSQWQRRKKFCCPSPTCPRDHHQGELAKDALTQYPRYKKYQLACTKNVYNDHHTVPQVLQAHSVKITLAPASNQGLPWAD